MSGGEEDIIATHPTPKEGSSVCSDDLKLQNEEMPQMSYRNQGFMGDEEQESEDIGVNEEKA